MQQTRLTQGGTVAEKSFAVLASVGIVEVLAGMLSLSVALIADGILSFADASVSLIVWIGLRLSRKAPDGKFHFGYYRVETFSSFIAAVLMAVFGAIIFYRSYLVFLAPVEVLNAEAALIVALSAAIVASVITIYKARAARKYRSLALKTDALNSVKDVFTSVAALLGIAFNKYLHIAHADSIAGIIIAFFVFTVAYSIVKEASFVLMDACECEDIVSDVQNVAESIGGVREVHNIRMRQLGPYLVGDLHVVVDPEMSVKDADQIANQIEEKIKQEFDTITEIKVRIEPPERHSKN